MRESGSLAGVEKGYVTQMKRSMIFDIKQRKIYGCRFINQMRWDVWDLIFYSSLLPYSLFVYSFIIIILEMYTIT